jgi:hypothetical protein
LLPDVLADERSESRGGGEGERRLQFDELGPVGMRSLRRSGLRDWARYDPLGPDGGDLLRIGDLARIVVRSRSYGDLDLRLYRISCAIRICILNFIPVIPWRPSPLPSIIFSAGGESSWWASGSRW